MNFFNPDERTIKYDWVKKVDYAESGREALSQNVTANGEYKITSVDSNLKEKIKNKGTTPSNAADYWKVATGNSVMPAGATTKVYTENGTTYIYKYWQDQSGTQEVVLVKNDSQNNSQESHTDELKGLSYDLRNTISKWYYTLRAFAIVGMMTVLVYIGIRILLSSTSSQKSKYKQLLGDWFVGMVLLFTLHFIMVFSNIFVDNLTATLTRYNPSVHVPFLEDKLDVIKSKLEDYNIETTESAKDAKANPQKVYIYKEDGKNYIEWHTDLMGHIRIKVRENQGKDEIYVGYTIMFLVIVAMVTFFIFTYLKRVILLAFLTVIAPLVALTYPIDKANDGSAQGFNFWFKEYIFNLLIQPLHLLIYTILVSSALDLATRNWIYSLVALGFIGSAEKLVRQMFNFSKATTPGVFAGPAGAAMVMSGMRWLFGHGPRGPQGGPRRGALGNGSGNPEDSNITSSGNSPSSQDRVKEFLARSNANNNNNSNTSTPSSNNSDDYDDYYMDALSSRPYTDEVWNDDVLEEGYGYGFGSGFESKQLTGTNSNDFIDEQPGIRMQDNIEGYADDYDVDYSDYDDYYANAMSSSPYTSEEWNDDVLGSGYFDNGNNYVGETERLEALGDDAPNLDSSSGGTPYMERNGNNPTSMREDSLEGEENPTPIIQDRSIGDVDSISGNATDGRTTESISEQGNSYTEMPVSTTSGTESNSSSGQTKERWSRAREYIESKESGEAIDRRRIKEKIKDHEKQVNTKKAEKRRIRNEVLDEYKDRAKRRVAESLQNGEPVRAISGAVGGLMGAATAGTLGLAIGIASGEPKNVTTYATAGIAGGAKLGSSITSSNQRRISDSTKDLTDTYERASLGEKKYKEKKAHENKMKAAYDEKNIKYAQRKLNKSRNETKKYLKEIFPEYMEAGINDIKDMLVLEKMLDKKNTNGREYSRKDAITAYNVLKKSGVDTNDRERALKRIKSDWGASDEDAARLYTLSKDLDRLYS